MKINLLVAFSLATFFLLNCKSENSSSQTGEVNDVVQEVPLNEVLDTQHLASMDFKEEAYRFGEVQEGVVIKKYFSFMNSGTEPLVISDVRTSCGCTTAEVPKTPVEPGQSDSLLVQFDTKGRPGYNSKAITIVANTKPSTHHIFLKGNVIQ